MPTFDPIPVPGRQSLANPPPPSATQKAALDTNFARINQHYQSLPMVSGGVRSRAENLAADLGPPGVWAMFGAWPPGYLVIPDCAALILYVGALVATSWQGYINIAAVLSGPGVVGEPSVSCAFNSASWVAGGATKLIDRSQLVVGQAVDLTGRWMVQATATYRVHNAEMGVIPLG